VFVSDEKGDLKNEGDWEVKEKNDVDKGVTKMGDWVGGSGRGISKISMVWKKLLLSFPPPKNILFIDDVDASP
jgi:hypothetical protein